MELKQPAEALTAWAFGVSMVRGWKSFPLLSCAFLVSADGAVFPVPHPSVTGNAADCSVGTRHVLEEPAICQKRMTGRHKHLQTVGYIG